MIRNTIFALCVAALSLPAAAAGLIDGSNPQAVLNIAQNYGSASLSTDDQSDPLIEGEMSGKDYRVFFYDCEAGINCKAIQFWAYYTGAVTEAQMTDWNRTQRFGKAYIDSDGDASIEWDVNLRGGVSTANLDDSFDWWRIVMDNFRDHLGQ